MARAIRTELLETIVPGRSELQRMTRELDVPGRSSMDRDEPADAIGSAGRTAS